VTSVPLWSNEAAAIEAELVNHAGTEVTGHSPRWPVTDPAV